MPDVELTSDYVTAGSWTDPPGRAEHIDDVADQFERPSGAEQFWSGEQAGWPRQPDPQPWVGRHAG